MKPGERMSARVSFSHAGRLPLSNRALCLSYHWLDADDPSRTRSSGRRRERPCGVSWRPGEIWTGEVTLQAPVEPGRYLLQVDLVREGVAWFSRQGVAAVETTVRVE